MTSWAAQQLEQVKTMEALENIPILEPILILDFEPFTKAAVLRYSRLMFNYKSKICIEIQAKILLIWIFLEELIKFITLTVFLVYYDTR